MVEQVVPEQAVATPQEAAVVVVEAPAVAPQPESEMTVTEDVETVVVEAPQELTADVMRDALGMPAPAPVPLIDRLTEATAAFAAAVQAMESSKASHAQSKKAVTAAENVADRTRQNHQVARGTGVAAADRLVEVVNEWRAAASS